MPGRALPNIPPSAVLQPLEMEEPPQETDPTACPDCPLSQLAQRDGEAGSWVGASARPGTESSQNRVPQWGREEQLQEKVPRDCHGAFCSSLRWGDRASASSPVLSQTWTPLAIPRQHSSQPGVLEKSNPCGVFAWGGGPHAPRAPPVAALTHQGK